MKIIKVEKCDSECPYFFADGNSFIDCKLSNIELVSATMVNGFPVWCELKDAPQKTVEAQDSATNKQRTPLGSACVNCIHVPCCHCYNGSKFEAK